MLHFQPWRTVLRYSPPGPFASPWASDHPGDSPGASLVSELGLCGWLRSTPAWFADIEKRHREGHLVPQGRSVADCSRAPWQRPPEKGREWSKRRTGRLRARRAPPSLILAAHDAAFRHSAAASGSHTHLRHRLAAADNLQSQPSPLSTNPHPRVAPCRPCSPSLHVCYLFSAWHLWFPNGCRRTAGAATSDSGAAAGG